MILPSIILFIVPFTLQNEGGEDTRRRGAAVMLKTEFKHSGKIMENARSYQELIRNSDKFIDKSHFINSWHVHCSEKITELRCAPRWGKTITLHMVKDFFKIELFENFTIMPTKEASNYKLFMQKRIVYENGEEETLQEKLNVNSLDTLIMTKLGNYPVILLSFENVTASSYDQFVEQIGTIIGDVFEQFVYVEGILEDVTDVENIFYENDDPSDYDYVPYKDEAAYKDETDYDSDVGDRKEKDNLNKAFAKVTKTPQSASNKFRKILERRATAEELISSVHLLSKLLHKYYSKKVLILIDDYDCIFEIFFLNDICEQDRQSIRKFYASLLLNSLQHNQYVKRSLITGTYDVKSLLNGLKTTLFNTSISILYNPCGFTRFDIDRMFRSYPIDAEANRKARQWYNGYRCGRKLSITLHEIEPFVSIFNAGNFTLYEIPNMVDDYLRESIKVKRFRGILVNSITGKNYLKQDLHKDDAEILKLKKIPLTWNTDIEDTTRERYMSLLLASGYFTIRMNGSDVIVQLPNHRIKHKLSEMLMDYYKSEFNIEQSLIDNVITETYNFMENDTVDSISFTQSLYKFFRAFPLYNDIFPLYLMKYVFHYFALKISYIYNYRLLEVQVVLGEPMMYFSLFTLERKVIFGIKLSNMLSERMVVLLHMLENSTTLAPESSKYTKIVALAIPRHGDFILHHEVLKNS